jgi:pimeloyl-ACP methyl ester carboxylesterase
LRVDGPAFTTAPDGLRIATLTWSHGSGGPTVLALHANGFCKEVAGPIAEELARRLPAFELVAIDLRGHGDSDEPTPPLDWWDHGRDALAVLAGATGVIGLGHSSGGAAVVMAELLAPGTFGTLVLVEPIIFPPPYRRDAGVPLATVALKRRRTFSSPAAAADGWRGRGPFAGWDERALQAYVRGGLRERDGSWELKCRPEIEAEFFRMSTAHGAYERLAEIDVPVRLIAGEHSDTHGPALLAALSSRFPRCTVDTVPGATHFVPMEMPAVVAEAVAVAAEGLGRGDR